MANEKITLLFKFSSSQQHGHQEEKWDVDLRYQDTYFKLGHTESSPRSTKNIYSATGSVITENRMIGKASNLLIHNEDLNIILMS